MCEERVRVAARVRPLSLSESERGEAICVSVPDTRSVAIWSVLGHGHTDSRTSLVSVAQVAEAASPAGATFTFDVAFGPAPFLKEEDHQHGIYEELGRPLLQSALEGISGCLFAYGQTGSGKTFSLFGTQAAPGIFPRLARELIDEKLKMASDGVDVTVRAAFLEVYNENLVDLLGETRDPLRLFESSSEGVLVPGLSEREIDTQHEFSSLLDYATRNRSVGSTCTNEHSSRSHAMIQLKVTVVDKERTARAKMFLTDLAGSERQKKAKNDGQRMKEGIHINVSLSTLGLVISRLAEIAQGRNHCSVPFRDSKLTFLLKDSLSGNARTEVLIALSPSASSYEESLSTLRFAQSVKKVRTRAVADLVYSSADMVLALQAEVSRLQAELEISRCQKLHPLQFQSPRKTAGSAPATPQHTKTAGPNNIDTSNFARYGSVDELPVPDGGLLEELDTEKAHDWLQGSYVSPTGRQIEVSREGHVYFGGGGHHPIRICIAYVPSRSSVHGGGSEQAEGIARRVRLTSEGDPAYRYVLVAHDQNGVTWRHEDDNASGHEVRWRREEPLSTDIGREVVLSQAVQEALHTVQLASRASAALAKVAKSTRSWAKSLIPFRGDDAVIEALESLVCLAAKVDEANSLLALRRGGGGSGGSIAPATSVAYSVPPGSPFGEEVLRFEISWLAAELNPELSLSDLLCILVHSLAQSDVSPSARKRMQVWSKSDFQLKLKDAQLTARASVPESARVSPGSNNHTPPRSSSNNGIGPLTLQSLRGRYVTADCDEVAVSADGQVDIAGRRLQLEADGKQARLFCPQERGGRAPLLRLHTREPCGVLLWESAVSERLLAQAWRESASSKDNGSEGTLPATADDEVPLVWTPLPVDDVPAIHRTELAGQPLLGSQSQGRLVPSEQRFVPADCSPRRPPALPGSVLAKPSGSPGPAAANGSNNHNHNHNHNNHHNSSNNNNHNSSNSTPALLSAAGGGGGASGSSASGSSIGARARAVLLANAQMMASSPPPPPHSALSSVLQHRRPRSADPGRGRVQSQAEGKSERLQRSPTPVTGRRRRSLSAASSRPKLGVAAGGGEAMVAARSFDKNSLRLRNGAVFVDALEGWRRAHLQTTNPQRPPPNGATVSNNHNSSNTNANSNNHQRRSQLACAIFVRKRPMFEHEMRRCDFDVLTVLPLSTASKPVEGGTSVSSVSSAASQEIIHHSCMFDKTGVSPFILHTQFTFDGVFDVDTKNEDVYSVVAKPLLDMAVQDGQVATLFVFGQTGSGKTYTMRAMEGAIAADLFGHMASGSQISLTYFELAGRKALDLLTEQKTEIRLREEEDGCFRPHDCTEAAVSSAEDLLKVMAEAAGRRATDATTVSASSSRSHSVCRIRIAREGRAAGQLLLVDCAGTERSRDTLYLRGQNVKESAEINSSLFALKDCIRSRHAAMARHQGGGGGLQDGQALKLPSVRATLLTKVLAESLLSPSAQLAAIATVSPNATDSEHTIDTLRIVHTLGGRGEGRVLEVRQSLE